ncbi:hypothetical cytosolic protein [Syntrophus aciditrophicus SB]|uniref:Hypothetical cytosolic protein n=1 Tax=Syntrophus aciditrophicus (strain SB) TaxID=56780 RepID=Q2LSC5_SYNAS|nr:hypothetical cytosolic protein [Syntrophus aciditrophicus SB]
MNRCDSGHARYFFNWFKSSICLSVKISSQKISLLQPSQNGMNISSKLSTLTCPQKRQVHETSNLLSDMLVIPFLTVNFRIPSHIFTIDI